MTLIKIQLHTQEKCKILVNLDETRKVFKGIRWDNLGTDTGTFSVKKNYDIETGFYTLQLKVLKPLGRQRINYTDLLVWKDGVEIYKREVPMRNKQKIRMKVRE